MIELALAHRIDGIVFAPLNKAALHAGGWHFNDEHQMFAHLTHHQGFFGEMNVLDNLWMSRVTSHVSLRTALEQITGERIDAALSLADATMRSAGFATPRIAVAALNPHAGEGGRKRPVSTVLNRSLIPTEDGVHYEDGGHQEGDVASEFGQRGSC
jgi:4-hydroxythreonine-4-phosphate dehydrogenase